MEQASTTRPRFDWSFWIDWQVATVTGIALCDGIGTGVLSLLRSQSWYIAAPLFLIVGYAVVGFAQWLVLRQLLPRSKGWILAGALGFLAGLGAGAGVFYLIQAMNSYCWWIGIVSILGAGMALGGIVGLAQFFFLRRHVARAGRWIPASIAAWTIVAVLWNFPSWVSPDFWFFSPFDLWPLSLFFLLGTAVASGGTGAVLLRLLQQRAEKEPAFSLDPATGGTRPAGTGRLLSQLSPGMILAGLSGVVQLMSFNGPWCAEARPDYHFLSYGYAFFADNVYLALRWPKSSSLGLWFGVMFHHLSHLLWLALPLGAVAMLVGFVRHRNRPLGQVRRYALLTTALSAVSLVLLVRLLLGKTEYVALGDARIVFTCAILLLLGSLLNLAGLDWLALGKLRR